MNNKIKILNYLLVSTLSSVVNAEIRGFSISEEDYESLQNLSKLINRSEEETINIGLSSGKLIVDQSGRLLFISSAYEILKDQNLIEANQTSFSGVCQRTGTN